MRNDASYMEGGKGGTSRLSCLALRSPGLVRPFSFTADTSRRIRVGKAYHIKEVTRGTYFYPIEDGQSETSSKPRALKDDEIVCVLCLYIVTSVRLVIFQG